MTGGRNTRVMPVDGDFAHHTLTPEKPRQSRAAKIAQPDQPRRRVPLDVPGFSIELLGRQLALTGYRQRLLYLLGQKVGEEKFPCAGLADMTPDTLNQRHVKHVQRSTDDHYYALRDLILRSRPVTPADVVVQLLVCLGATEDRVLGENDEAINTKIDRVLANAVRVLGQYHGLTLADLGGAEYAGTNSDKWPDVDVDHLREDTDPSWLRAIDGSLSEWER